MITDLLITLLLVFLNGFFVAAEFAIVKVRASQVEIKANQGNPLGAYAKNITSHLDRYLSATQLGITLASLGLGWIGESVVSKIVALIWFQSSAMSQACPCICCSSNGAVACTAARPSACLVEAHAPPGKRSCRTLRMVSRPRPGLPEMSP